MLVYQRVDFGMCIDLLERTSQTHVAVFKSHKLSRTAYLLELPKDMELTSHDGTGIQIH